MRRKLILPGLLLALILFSGKRCADESPGTPRFNETDWIEAKDSLMQAFGTEYLDAETRIAFEALARQKVQDYADYRNLAGDVLLDSVFRQQALSLMKDLFGPGVTPPETVPGETRGIDSVWRVQPLHREGKDLYSGILGCRERIVRTGEEREDTNKFTLLHVQILAIKVPDSAAHDAMDIWKVYLGSIK